MQDFNSIRVSNFMRMANATSAKIVRSLTRHLTFSARVSAKDSLKFQKNKTASQAISNDWKKVGEDMASGVIKYDRQLTKHHAEKSEK